MVDENIMNYPDFDRNTKRVTKVTLLFSVVPPGIELSQQLIANQYFRTMPLE